MHRLSDGIRSTHNLEGATVLDITHGQMFRVNHIGSRILELLKSGQRESQIAATIASEFSISEQVVSADVREFLKVLASHNIVM
jgi:Coenzyme PQQ synthesis protein D (PqqD)